MLKKMTNKFKVIGGALLLCSVVAMPAFALGNAGSGYRTDTVMYSGLGEVTVGVSRTYSGGCTNGFSVCDPDWDAYCETNVYINGKTKFDSGDGYAQTDTLCVKGLYNVSEEHSVVS